MRKKCKKLKQKNNEEEENMLDCGLITLTWNTNTQTLQLTSSRADQICGQVIHHPFLPLPPLTVQELNYSDNLALFVVVIITFCKHRSANENTDTRSEMW